MESKNLRKLLNEYEEIDINEMLKNFRSIKNSGTKNDIEIFLHEKAIKFEKSSISSTYVVFSEDNEILGYFTIANRSLVIPKENFGILSKTQQKKLGNSAAILKNGDLMTSSFLLGQLGKNYSDDIKEFDKVDIDKETEKILTEVYNVFGEYSAWGLRNLIHTEKPYVETKINNVIPQDLMKESFKENYV